MAYDLEEQEQIEQLKAWWRKYGALTLGLLTLALAAVLGWQSWNWYQGQQASQARGYFEALERAKQEGGADAIPRVLAAMGTLQTEFPDTDYAGRAALLAAQSLQQGGDLTAAQAILVWLSNSKHTALAPVAKIRLAGLLLDQQQYEQALNALQSPAPSFEALFADRRGDIFAAQGESQKALEQWRLALASLGANQGLASALQLKIDMLGG
jgi:predicted negative regulator of RcsB-dependent stress response|uniref:YfgM family protein n=1 Tax=Orrella sp. TaxID=1921583 RepID=UPI004047FC78